MANGMSEQSAWYRRPLSSAAVFGIAEFFLWLATGLSMPWWATGLVLLGMWGLAATVILFSEWTIGRPWITKGVLCILAAWFVWALGAKTVREQLALAHASLSITPSTVTFNQGGESYSFRADNETDQDAYSIAYIFRITPASYKANEFDVQLPQSSL